MSHLFGVRRPLRFLSNRLELDDSQREKLATILGQLKIERAQSAVDNRRTLQSFADAIAEESFLEDLARKGAEERDESTKRVTAAVLKALGEIHAMLTNEQRSQLAYLIRTEQLVL